MWENNLKAPRFRSDEGRVYLDNKEMAKEFLAENPDLGFTSEKQVLNVLKDIHMTIRNIAQEERDGFEIPHFGVLRHSAVSNPKMKRETARGITKEQYIDYQTSFKLKQMVRFTNFDTDSKILKIRLEYGLIKYAINFRSNWCFNPCRDYKRAASKSFKKNYNKLTQK